MFEKAGDIKNTVVLIFWHIQCFHFMNFEVAWALVSFRTLFQPQIVLDPGYLPDYLSVSYHYNFTIFSGFSASKTNKKYFNPLVILKYNLSPKV